MSNPNNTASVIGNLATDPKIMPHSNGTSGTALITVYARNNYRDKDGEVGSVRVDLEEYVSDVNNPGIYAFLSEGMLVAVSYSIANADYTKNGEQVFGMKLEVNRGGIQMLESKADTAARQSRKAQNTAQPQAEGQAPAQAPAQAPVQQTAMPQPSQNYAAANQQQAQAPAYNYAAAAQPQSQQVQNQPAPAQAPVDPYAQTYMPGVPVTQQNSFDEPPF